jgi:hypothetical protein
MGDILGGAFILALAGFSVALAGASAFRSWLESLVVTAPFNVRDIARSALEGPSC